MITETFTDQETAFLLELLEAESLKLMRETRHTDARDLRHDMRERMRMADRLTDRVREARDAGKSK